MNLKTIMREAHENNVNHGFVGTDVSTHIALMHSELSEAFESYRKGEQIFYYGKGGKPEGLLPELADVVIRIASFCEERGFNLVAAIQEKMGYNKTRPFKHGGKRF